MKDKYRIRR